MTQNNYDKNNFGAERYKRIRRERDLMGGSHSAKDSSSRPSSTVDEFSRDNAAKRYRTHKRHTSRGGQNFIARILENRKAAAASGSGDAIACRRYRKMALIILICVFAALLIACAVWYSQVSAHMASSEDVSDSVSAEQWGQPYYVLLLGSDSRSQSTDVARADSIMLTRVDSSAKKVALVSMPRDLLVDIPSHGASKLNSALTYGGFSGMIEAASEVSGEDISYYAVIYFSGFKKLVRALGGVRVDVPAGTYYHGVWVNGGKAGKNVKINGKEALVLARCRHGYPPDQGAYAAGDYQRTINQRNLMRAIVKKILKKPFWEIPGLISSFSECVETNMPAYKFAVLAMTMKGMSVKKDMYSATMPATSQYIGGVSFQVLDKTSWAAMKERLDAGKDPN